MDFDVRDLDRMERPVIARIARHAGDRLDQLHRGRVALAENRVAAIQVRAVGNVLSNEKLRAVGIRSGVGIGETSGAIEFDGGRSLILEFVARIAGAVSGRIAPLNHETRELRGER